VVTFAVAGWAGTGSALVVAAAILTASVAGFACSEASRRWRPVPMATARARPLSSGNLRVLVTALVGVGVLFGATEVAVTALSTTLGAPGAAGLLLGLWGLGSLSGGVVTARSAGGAAQTGRGLAVLLVALGAGHAALAVADGHWLVLGALIIAAGSMIAPILATSYGMVERVAPTGTRTEAFAWLATATAAGTAIGAALAGVLVDARGAGAGFLLAGVAAMLSAVLVGARLRLDARVWVAPTTPPRTRTDPPAPEGDTRAWPSSSTR
jgi:MFS family permease